MIISTNLLYIVFDRSEIPGITYKPKFRPGTERIKKMSVPLSVYKTLSR